MPKSQVEFETLQAEEPKMKLPSEEGKEEGEGEAAGGVARAKSYAKAKAEAEVLAKQTG